MHGTVIIFMSLEVGGRAAIGFIIIRNAWACQHFHRVGMGRKGGGWLQNHKKYKDCHDSHGFGNAREGGFWPVR